MLLTTGLGPAQPGSTVTLARESIYESGAHIVTSSVVLEHLSDDPVNLVSVSLGCRDKNGIEQRMGHYINTLAAAPLTVIEPHVVFHATDDFVCWVAARAMRINTAPGSGDQAQAGVGAVDRTQDRAGALPIAGNGGA
jgi:hypothetical protein